MAYPRRLLNEGEELVLDLRPHWWYFAKHVGAGVVLLVLFVLLVPLDGSPGTVAMWAWSVVALVFAGWLAYAFAQWSFTMFVVTTERVIYRTGVVARHGVEIPLDRISNIVFRQPLWERLIGAGDLEIESAGQDGQSVFEDVWHPDGVQQELYKQIKEHRRQRAQESTRAVGDGAGVAAPSREASIPEQIEQLARLRDRGVITAAEFEAKKTDLLERM